jgi:hypothetical protein
MNKYLFLFALLPILLSSCGSTKTINEFYRKHKKEEGVSNFSLPGWLVWIGTGMAYHSVRDKEVRRGLKLAKKVKSLQFLQSEGEYSIPKAEIQEFVSTLRTQAFEDLLFIRDGQTNVNVMVRDTEKKLKNILIFVEEEDEFTFFSMRSRLKYKDLSEYINYYIRDYIGLEQPGKKKPQA